MLLDEVPSDVHEMIVSTLMAQPRRPEALVSLTSTCKQLRQLLPADIQREAARDRVDHTLEVRPSPGELHALGIMPCTPNTSARIAERQRMLQREMTRSALGSSLTSRRSDSELRHQGILKSPAAISPCLADTADRLERQLRRDLLKHSVERRPDAQELRDANIVKTPAALSSCLAETADQLEKRLKRHSLTQRLERRRSLGELTSAGILKCSGCGIGAESFKVASTREVIELRWLKSFLERSLENRPTTLEEMEEHLQAKGLIWPSQICIDDMFPRLLRQQSAPVASATIGQS